MSHNKSWMVWLCMLGFSLLACCSSKDIKLVDISYGETGMSNSILVVYDTWAGSTAEVADVIGKTLAEGRRQGGCEACRISEEPGRVPRSST